MELKDIKLVKGMTKEEVNELIGEWILLEDDVYINASHKHNWKCVHCRKNIIKGRQWNNIRGRNSTKCNLCKGYARSGENLPYKLSFAYYIEKELGLKLEDVWDFEKNTVNPYHIAKKSNDNVWIKCTNKKYHESHSSSCSAVVYSFNNGNNGCPNCINRKVHPLDSIGTINPKLADMIVYDENKKEVDIFNIAPYSNNKFYFRCPDCGKVNTLAKTLSNVAQNGLGCSFCSDGISIPEKFISNILRQINIEFITQLSKTTFNWIVSNKKYDFYLPKYNMIIETHGKQHYSEFTSFRRSLSETQNNDTYKRELALSNGIKHYIEIDCRKSEFNWLRDNIIKSLSPYFNLNNVDWDKAWRDSQSSNVVKAWELWNSGIRSTIKIGKILNVGKSTARSYLKKGASINVVDYNPEDFKNFKQLNR